MRVIIYESSSFGGCFHYALSLHQAYQADERIESVHLLVPHGTEYQAPGVLSLLSNDQPSTQNSLGRKWTFVWRQLASPVRLYLYLRRQPSSIVIINDFEQLTAPLWVPLLRRLKRRHQFVLVLHDPDRDAYPPSVVYAGFTMRLIVSLMDLVLYHEYLPDKPYYKVPEATRFVSIPHGIYSPHEPDQHLLENITQRAEARNVISIIGNIRQEKNYDVAIQALKFLPDVQLLIAGNAAHSGVDVEALRTMAVEHGVADQVIWIERYLTDEEMAAAIIKSDVILLYYRSSFASQSGILNLIAPFRKPVIIADSQSSLAQVARTYGLGKLVAPDQLPALVSAIQEVLTTPEVAQQGWPAYTAYASWQTHVDNVLDALT
ncbi:Glycosyltransferase involved in cell wall bisynthesis [Catalinimonas alkaloidigena]|uniref:Glycosyltransferase involved in cell wall bisynthesis n=1 Tax=Catalinimonas alkaloidigena TaxID=1075417 RepID=A0A1G9LF43_9BACT|nr:glycosyltransferase [Catalinimonas alkaloidigena]SDL60135.1 Glycosyltransferase involved in cell wall bisynthesis [Catalinimonas alkaloidigena]